MKTEINETAYLNSLEKIKELKKVVTKLEKVVTQIGHDMRN